MATKERLYERKVKKPLDKKKKELLGEIVKKKLGGAIQRQEWNDNATTLTVTTQHVTFILSSDAESLYVDAEYSWLARFLVTEDNRKQAREMAMAIADEAGL